MENITSFIPSNTVNKMPNKLEIFKKSLPSDTDRLLFNDLIEDRQTYETDEDLIKLFKEIMKL